jgi:metal-responsive CopG/Arc/MetJ family transcriptional regulator
MISATRPNVGRKKVNHEQTPLRLPEGTLAKVDALLTEGEKRADFLRDAIEAEIARRERKQSKAS